MKLAAEAWYTVSETTIANCWRKSGILSSRDHDGSVKIGSEKDCLENLRVESIVEQAAEEALISDLDTIQSLGLVHPTNRMSITNLLNPVGEHTSGLEEWTPEEIFQSIQDEEKENELAENDPIPTPRPTHKKFLEASETMLSYLRCEDGSEARRYETAIRAAVRHCRRIRDKAALQPTLLELVSKNS